MSDRLEANARTVSLLTLASRVTGLAREAVLSRVFGAAGVMDAFFLAFLIPNLFRRLFGEGALSAAFLPVFAELDRNDPVGANRLATAVVSMIVVVLGTVVVLGELTLLLLSARSGHQNLAIWLTMIMLPYTPLVCLVAVVGAMLHVRGRFGPTAAAPIVLNACMISAAVGAATLLDGSTEELQATQIAWVAGAVVLAGVIQLLWSFHALRDRPWWTPGSRGGEAMRRVMSQALPMIVGLGVLQLNTFLDGLIASYPTTIGPTLFGVDYPLREGAMASVSFAQRLYQFPLGVFGIAVATAIFPLLAQQAGDADAFRSTIQRGLRLVVFIGLPASVGLVLVRHHLVAVVLEGGAFTSGDTRRVGAVLMGYAPAIWAYAMVHVLTRGFYARGEARTPVKVAVGVVALNLTLNLTLIWTPLREAALAWSTALCSALQSLLLVWLLARRTGRLLDADVLTGWARTGAAAALMLAVVGPLAWWLPEPESWTGALVALVVLVTTGVAVVIGAALALRMPELRWAIGRKSR